MCDGVSLTPYDPVLRHEAIQRLVTRKTAEIQEKKYWRFRLDRWYGGIATADVVGCGLICKFCWVSDSVMFRTASVGTFYSAEQVAMTLTKMAEKRGVQQLRVSGGEPTIGKEHLLELLACLNGRNLLFVLETNGILIGHDEEYSKQLSRFRFVHVRVSLKGCNEEEFAKLTGAKPEGFHLQLRALENLVESKVKCNVAVMASFSPPESLNSLVNGINEISPRLAREMEIEELILYPRVQRKIEKHNLRYLRAFTPKGLPKELV